MKGDNARTMQFNCNENPPKLEYAGHFLICVFTVPVPTKKTLGSKNQTLEQSFEKKTVTKFQLRLKPVNSSLLYVYE